MVGWHHWLNGRESQWAPGVGDGQGGLACCDSWGRKESDTTERLIWSDLFLTEWFLVVCVLRWICLFPLNCQIYWHKSCSRYFFIILSTSVESVVISSLVLETGNLCLFVLVSLYGGLLILLTSQIIRFLFHWFFQMVFSVFSFIDFYSNHHFLCSLYFWHNFLSLSFLTFLSVGATWSIS